VKTGRPKNEERRGELVNVGFKADVATLDAIKVLTAEARRQGVVAPKSSAIRAALQEVAARVKARPRGPQ
jgi:hypothetical protein